MLGLGIKQFFKNKFLFKTQKPFATIDKIFDKKKIQEYKEKGYAVLPKVFSAGYIDELRAEVDSILSKVDINDINSTFDPEHLKSDKYFIESGDKVIYLFKLDSLFYGERCLG
jgi:hypothetical protein